MPLREAHALTGRLRRRTCPRCHRMVILEPSAKEGDVLLCPGCQARLKIARSGGQVELVRWKEFSLHVR